MRTQGAGGAAERGCAQILSGRAKGWVFVLLLLAIAVLLLGLLSACGSETTPPPGTYVYKSGDSSFTSCTLTMGSDNSWTVSGSDGQWDLSGGGTWKLTWTGMAIKFFTDSDADTLKAEYDGTEIEFDDVVWTRAQ